MPDVVDDWMNALGKPVPIEARTLAVKFLADHGYDVGEACVVIDVVAREVEHDQPERAQRYLRTFVGDRNLTLMYMAFAVMLVRGQPETEPEPETTTITFDEEEVAKLSYLVRTELRKIARGRRGMARKWGDEADYSNVDRKQTVLEACYRKLGGDPDNITNREG